MKKIIGILLIAIIMTIVALWWKKTPIENYLQGQISDALTQQQLANVQIRMDGREAYLTGSVPMEQDIEKTRSIANAVWGVGGVHTDLASTENSQQNLLSQVQAALKAGKLNWASAALEKLRVTVSGSTANPQQFESLGKALQPFQGKIDNHASMNWAGYFKGLLSKAGLGWATAAFSKGTLTLKGEAPNQGALDKLAGFFSTNPWVKKLNNQTKLSADALAQLAQAKEATMAAEKAAQAKADAAAMAAKKAAQAKADANTAAQDKLAACKQKIENSERAVYFDHAKSTLTTVATTTLDQLRNTLRDCPMLTLYFSGHTDSTGATQRNQALSQQRVQTVLDYVQRDGLGQQASTQALADTKPKSNNQTAQGRQQNRRVEWQLID